MTKSILAFEPRMYSKVDLAQLYCPHLSTNRSLQNFYRWMHMCPLLIAELQESGYNKYRHHYLRKEVEIIRKHLGDP